uniref:Lipocalin/cytosolic fatty-acid binding domain-containing protein n=1 Tax=Xiphophorus couchianus TaxID=32473 RepID=A0A3B5LFV4_9TELE
RHMILTIVLICTRLQENINILVFKKRAHTRGKWYLIGFATNSKWFINIKNTMKMGVATLVSTAEGDVDLSYASRGHRERNADGSCWRRSNRAKKTDMPGKFTFVSWGSKNDIIVVDVKYDDYALVYDIKTKQKVNKIIHLYGKDLTSRRDEVSANVKEKFKQLALDAGTLAENIVFLPKNGTFKSLDPCARTQVCDGRF